MVSRQPLPFLSSLDYCPLIYLKVLFAINLSWDSFSLFVVFLIKHQKQRRLYSQQNRICFIVGREEWTRPSLVTLCSLDHHRLDEFLRETQRWIQCHRVVTSTDWFPCWSHRNSDMIRSDQIRLDQIRSVQTWLEQIRLDMVKSDMINSDQIRHDQIRHDQIRLDQIRHDQIRIYMIRPPPLCGFVGWLPTKLQPNPNTSATHQLSCL